MAASLGSHHELESSAYRGRPIILYEFLRTSGDVDFFWRYNSSDRDISYQGQPWKAVPISDSGVRLSSDSSSTELTVTMPIAEEVCDQFRLSGAVPSDSVWLRVRRVHAAQISGLDGANPTVMSDALITWIGTVNGVTQIDELTANVTCAMLSASFQRGGLRYGYQHGCPHVLYAPLTCKVNRELFRWYGTVLAIDRLTLECPEFAPGYNGIPWDHWFGGGYIEYTLPTGMLERRMIVEHNGPFIRLVGLPNGIVVGDVISGFPGCDLTVETCIQKFGNLANFGGFPHMPGRNPFDGNPVF